MACELGKTLREWLCHGARAGGISECRIPDAAQTTVRGMRRWKLHPREQQIPRVKIGYESTLADRSLRRCPKQRRLLTEAQPPVHADPTQQLIVLPQRRDVKRQVLK